MPVAGFAAAPTGVETNSRKEPERGTSAPAAALIWKDSTLLSPRFSPMELTTARYAPVGSVAIRVGLLVLVEAKGEPGTSV